MPSIQPINQAVPYARLRLRVLGALVFLALASLAEAQFAPNTLPWPAVGTYTGTVYDSLPQQQTSTNTSMYFNSATTFTDGAYTTGTYTYTKTGANTATLNYTANTVLTGSSQTENSTALLTFTSAYGGTYTMSGSYSGLYYGTPFSGTLTNGSGTFTVRMQPTVTTPTHTAVQATTATLGGTVTADGGAALSARGVVCCPQSVSSTPYVGGPSMSSFNSPGGTGTYTVSATGLLPGTTYVYRAYATNNVGTTYTETQTFTTAPAAPTISTPTYTSVTHVSAVLGGNVTSDSGSTITERGVVFAPSDTNGDPLIGGTGVIKAVAAGTTGIFTTAVTVLPSTWYSFKAYATNAQGTTYTSPVTTFATFSGPPVISAPTIASLAQTTVTLGGTITSNGGSNVTERGVVLAETTVNSTPAIGGSGVTKGTSAGTTGTFSVDFTGLKPNTGYSFRAYGTNMYGTIYTTPVSTFTTASGPPLLSTPVSSGITSGSATLGGTVTHNGGASVSECGVVYAPTSVNADPQIGGSGVVRLTTTGATGAFTVSASGLQPGTGYTFRAYAINSFGTAYTSTAATFTTLPVLPTVTTPTSASVTAITATLGGNVTSDGAGSIIERGVVYALTATNPTPAIGGTGVEKTTTTGTTGILTAAVTGLTPFSGYSFSAYATNASGTSYSPIATFTTLASAPYFTAGSTSTNIMATTANLGGTVMRDNGSPITERGVVYSRTSVNSSPFIGGSGVTKLTTTPDIGAFSIMATGLSPSTGYSFRAYAINSLGTTYTSTGTFTTFSSSAPTVTTPTKANVTNSTATLGGNVTNDGHNLITERGVVYSITFMTSEPSIGNKFSTTVPTTGTTGVFTMGVIGLSDNTTYSFKAYAINAAGTSYSPVTTFTTAATGPPVVARAATTQDKLDITLRGNITTQGGITITERGIVYSKTGVNALPSIGGTGVVKVPNPANVQSGEFSVALTNLDPFSDYSWRPYAINSAGTAYSPAAGTFSTLAGNPTLASPTCTNVTATAATLGATVVTTGGRPITFYTACYALTSVNASPVPGALGVTQVEVTASSFNNPGAFTVNVTGLTPGGQYSFSVLAGHDDGFAQLVPAGTFTTLPGPPALDSPDFYVFSDTYVRLIASLVSERGAAITERGFVFAKTSVNTNPVIGGTGVTKLLDADPNPGTLGYFDEDIPDLVPNTAYSVKAYATNSVGTTYTSPVTTFATPTAAPRIDTPTSASITTNSALLGGRVISDGGLAMTRGVLYAPTAVNSDPRLSGTGVLAATTSGTTGVFTVNVTGLLPNTAYSFRAYADNSLGTGYTEPADTFTTPPGAPMIALPTVWTFASTTATIGGTLVHTGGSSITSRGVVISQTAVNADPVLNGTGVTRLASLIAGDAGSLIQSNATGLLPGTSYTFKAYATSSLGTGYCVAGTFTTTSAPVITTPTSTGITGSSAVLGANVRDTGGLATTRGVVYAPTAVSSSPTLGSPGVVNAPASSGGSGVFTVNVSGLTPGTAYSFRAYASNSQGTTYTSPASSFSTPALPTLELPTADSFNFTTARLGGTVTTNGGATLTERGVVFSTTAENADPVIGGAGVTKVVRSGTSTGVFTQNVTGLQPGIQYSYKAYATSSAGTAYTSPAATFTTLGLPLLSNPTVTGITPSTATLGGYANYYSPYTLTERGLVYAVTATNGNPLIGGAGVTRVVLSGTSNGAFTQQVTGLTPDTGYSFKAYAINSLGVAYTEPVTTFTTLPPSAPVITTPTSTGITGSSAVLGANVTDTGGLATTRGVVYAPTAVSSSPALGGPGVVDAPASSGGSGVFTVNVSGLAPGTDYSFRAYASNSQGTTYTSPASSFFTPVLPTLELPTAASLNFTTASLGGTITTNGGATLTERGVVFSTTAENADPVIGGAGVTKVVRSGTSTGVFTQSVTGLQPGIQYSYKAYATNGAGTAYTSPAATFTTLGLPLVSKPTVTGITPSTATLGGHATYYSSYPITERGLVYAVTATNGNPLIGGEGVTRVVLSGTTIGTFTQQVTGLTPGTGYSFKAYAINSPGVAYTEPVTTFTTLLISAPALDTPTATVYSDTYARLGAHMASDGGAAITERGVVFAKTSVNADPVIDGTGVTKRLADSDPGTLDSFSADVQDLTPNTDYSFKAYATNSEGTTYTSPVTTFSTPTAAPRVDTPTSTSITSISAVLGGTVISDGGLPMTRGVVYAPTAVNSSPQLGGTGVLTATASGTTGIFTITLTGLLPDTAYSFAAYADNSLGTAYTSPVSTFTTPTGAPVVAAPAVHTLTSSTALAGGTLVHTGGQSITQRGIVISATAVNADPVIGGTGVTEVVSGSSGDAGSLIQSSATGLLAGTSYTFKVYATNSLGTSYSDAGTLTTLTALQTWTQTHFGTTTSTGTAADDADPDRDGVANLVEYAFGLNPMQSASRLLPSPQKNGSTFSITFTQPAGVSGVTYGAQWNATLQPGGWNDIPDTGSGTTHIFSVPVGPGSGREAKVFIRLSLSR